MIELLIEPVKFFLSKGIDSFSKTAELKNLRLACVDRLKREIRFNQAILAEVLNTSLSNEEKSALLVCLKTDAFDMINDSPIPVKLIISGNLNKSDWDNHTNKDRYLQWMKNDSSIQDLLERVYFRIHVVKAIAPHSEKQRDYDYINYMLRCLMKELGR